MRKIFSKKSQRIIVLMCRNLLSSVEVHSCSPARRRGYVVSFNSEFNVDTIQVSRRRVFTAGSSSCREVHRQICHSAGYWKRDDRLPNRICSYIVPVITNRPNYCILHLPCNKSDCNLYNDKFISHKKNRK